MIFLQLIATFAVAYYLKTPLYFIIGVASAVIVIYMNSSEWKKSIIQKMSVDGNEPNEQDVNISLIISVAINGIFLFVAWPAMLISTLRQAVSVDTPKENEQ